MFDGREVSAVSCLNVVSNPVSAPSGFRMSRSIGGLVVSFPTIPISALTTFITTRPTRSSLSILDDRLVLRLRARPPLLGAIAGHGQRHGIAIARGIFAPTGPPQSRSDRRPQASSSSSPAADLYKTVVNFLRDILSDIPRRAT